MAVEVRIPELGESVTEGVIVRWLRDRELGKDEVHELLREVFLQVLGGRVRA